LKSRLRREQELAWASYALLRNTNAGALLLLRGGRAWLARGGAGAAAPGAADGPAALAALGQVASRSWAWWQNGPIAAPLGAKAACYV